MKASLLRNGVLQSLAGLEGGNGGGGDLHGGAGAGIQAGTGGALLGLKGAKAHQLHKLLYFSYYSVSTQKNQYSMQTKRNHDKEGYYCLWEMGYGS